jgi:hypothetical protein
LYFLISGLKTLFTLEKERFSDDSLVMIWTVGYLQSSEDMSSGMMVNLSRGLVTIQSEENLNMMSSLTSDA